MILLEIFEVNIIDQLIESDAFSWINALFSAFLLVAGVFLERLLQTLDKNRKNKNETHDLKTEIELLNQPVARQSAEVANFIEQINQDTFSPPRFGLVRAINVDRIKLIERRRVVEHLKRVHGKRDTALSEVDKIFSGLDVLFSNYDDLQSDFHRYVKYTQDLFEQWRDTVEELQGSIRRYARRIELNGGDPDELQLISSLRELTSPLSGTGYPDLFDFQESIHLPIIVAFAEHRQLPNLEEMISLNSLAYRTITRIRLKRDETVGRMQREIENIKNENDSLQELIKAIK